MSDGRRSSPRGRVRMGAGGGAREEERELTVGGLGAAFPFGGRGALGRRRGYRKGEVRVAGTRGYGRGLAGGTAGRRRPRSRRPGTSGFGGGLGGLRARNASGTRGGRGLGSGGRGLRRLPALLLVRATQEPEDVPRDVDLGGGVLVDRRGLPVAGEAALAPLVPGGAVDLRREGGRRPFSATWGPWRRRSCGAWGRQ